MAKKHSRRYTEQERAAILADMRRNGLTQVAASKKHGVSAMTIWTWNRAAKRGPSARRARGAVPQMVSTRYCVRRSVIASGSYSPQSCAREVASHVRQVLGSK